MGNILDMMKNVVYDLFEWRAGVDDPSRSDSLFRLVQTPDDVSFPRPAAPVGGVCENTLIDPLHHGVDVADFKHENTVEEVNEFRGIATAPTEKRDGRIVVCD